MNKTERPFTDSTLLRSFIEIAECKNLTLASSRLNRSQSAISVQIKKLEQELKASLFVRDGKGMALSASGEKLLPVARRVLAELAQVQTLFEAPLDGQIRVGIPDDFDEGVLERVLADFTKTNPGVEVLASSGCTMAFPDALRRGELDIAVCSGAETPPGEVFLEQQAVWAVGQPLYPLPDGPVPLAVINHGCAMGELPKRALEKQGRSYNVAFACSGLMSLKSAIRAGFAVGILFESSVEPGMRILTPRDGFPPLPRFKRSILVRPDAPGGLTKAMASAIEGAV